MTKYWKQFASTVLTAAALACGAAAQAGYVTIPISGQLTGTHNWVPLTGADTNIYLLNGPVYVLDGAVLNIEAGTLIKGKEAASFPNYGALFVCRGGKLNAMGTRLKPIIFTAEGDDPNDPFDIPLNAAAGQGRGRWGGVVILGKGIINRRDATTTGGDQTNDPSVPGTHEWQIYEGMQDVNGTDGKPLHRFGGADNDDNSGCLRFVSIRYSGKALESNKEINGLSMGAVGRGTTVEYVEVYCGADDGFEWWGGAVNSRYLVSTYCDDEMFDMDEGHIGKHQFWFGMQYLTSDDGFELNGQPSGGANVNAPGRTPLGKHQIYNVTLIGEGPGGTSGSDVMNTRSENYTTIRNSVFTQFQGRRAISDVAANYSSVENNLFFDIYGAGAAGDLYGTPNVPAASNPVADPSLRSIDRSQSELLDPRPLSTASPVYAGYAGTPLDGFFCPAPYKGAFTVNDNWLLGWTALYQNEHLKQRALVPTVISGQLTGVHNWTADKTYLLNGPVYVLDGATLNIEAGTIVLGKEAASFPNYGALFVCRGGKLNAVGSPSQPIIFTGEGDTVADPFDIPLNAAAGIGRGRWGGVVILGKGIINRRDATAVGGDQTTDAGVPGAHQWQIYEGMQDVNGTDGKPLHRFGGADNEDSSGVLQYVSIRYSGKALESNKEINGLSMGGVGRGTVVECVEVYCGADDGFEWWGGAVNTRYLVSTYCDDELFDMDEGHIGRHQFWFGMQSLTSDDGFELNGQPSGGANVNAPGLTPRGQHEIYNVTLLGEGPGGSSGSDVMNTRSENYSRIYNSVFTQFQGRRAISDVAPNYSSVENNLFFDIYGAGAAGDLYGTATVPAASNPIANPLLAAINRVQDLLLDPRPASGSPVFSGWRTPPVNSLFQQAAHKGAFDQELWCADWTALTDNEHLAYACRTTKCPLPAAKPAVAIVGGGNTAQLTWVAQPAVTYQVQVSTDLVTWANEGAPIRFAGEAAETATFTSTLAGAGAKKHFRVISRM